MRKRRRKKLRFVLSENSTYGRFVTFSVTDVTPCNGNDVTKKSFIFKRLTPILIVVTDVTAILGYAFKFSIILGTVERTATFKIIRRGYVKNPLHPLQGIQMRRKCLYSMNSFCNGLFWKKRYKTLHSRYMEG